MEPILYGPFARLADLYHGWRDGLSNIPPKAHWRRGQRISTPHREVLIRRAQDAFELERLRFEQARRWALDRLARAEAERDGAEAVLALAERELAQASVPPTGEQLGERRVAEEHRDGRVVRSRRMREHRLRRGATLAALRRARDAVTDADARIAAARQEATTQLAVAASRVRRIHEFTHRRLASYRRRLARSHPDPAWIVEGMSVLDPEIPRWAFSPYPGHELEMPPPARPPVDDDVVPDGAPEPPAERIELRSTVRFGSDPDRADVVLDWFWVAPHHFTVVPEEGRVRLLDRGQGNGPFVDGQPVRTALLVPGEYFDFGELRYEVSDDATALLVSPLAAPSLIVHDLSDSGGSRLQHMSFVQRNRTVVAILGPSGAGKSSLFYALLNELETSGRLYFRDLSLVEHREEIRTMLGFVPQADEMHQSLTVRQLLRFTDQLRVGPDHHGKRKERIEQTCESLGLLPNLDQLVRTLSGGQRKRVSIALEMIARPDLLMLDEPTSGLDPNMDREVMTILADYAERDRTVIVITHNTEHLRLAHRVLVLAKGGRPVFFGRPADALPKLGVRSWADLMKLLGTGDVDQHTAAYRNGSAAREAEREADRVAHGQARPNQTVKARRSIRPLHRELGVLSRRQLALLWAQRLRDRDRKKLRASGWLSWLKPLAGPAVVAMPLIIAVFGALLSVLIAGSDGFGPPAGPRQTPSPATALSLLTTLCMLNGQALTYSNIVSEALIIKREHRTGVRPLSVLLSKWWVFALIGTAQAGIITVTFCAMRPAPENYLVYGDGVLELFADLAMLTVASMSLGLLISALARRLEQAVAWVTAASIAQIALNGVTADLTHKWPLNALSLLLPTRMGLASTASSIGLRGLAPNTIYQDAMWTHSTSQWIFNTALVALQTVVFFTLAALILRRRLDHPDQ